MVLKLLKTIFVSLALILSSGTALSEELARPRVAVCVAGAVRSLTEEKVQSSSNKVYIDPDMFYHLYVGIELSLRGQREMVDPHAVTNALAVTCFGRKVTIRRKPLYMWPASHRKIKF